LKCMRFKSQFDFLGEHGKLMQQMTAGAKHRGRSKGADCVSKKRYTISK
jgi:hypothetical protein